MILLLQSLTPPLSVGYVEFHGNWSPSGTEFVPKQLQFQHKVGCGFAVVRAHHGEGVSVGGC